MKTNRYILNIKTNQYTGNFERELCSYVFGAYYEAQEWVDDLRMLFRKEEGNESPLTEILHEIYDDHGPTVCEIENQNALNVFFDEDPTPFKDIIMNRLKKFPAVLKKSWKFASKNVIIESVTLTIEKVYTDTLWKENL